MSIKPDLYHFLHRCLMYNFRLVKKGFTHWIILPFLLWYNLWAYFYISMVAQGSSTAVQRCPRWKQKWLRVKGACACVASSKGLEAKRNLITYTQEESLWVLKVFLVFFSHTDMSNKRSLLSNVAYFNLWHKRGALGKLSLVTINYFLNTIIST